MKLLHRGKDRRSHELITPAQRRTIHDMHKSHYEMEAICERFGLDDAAVVAILRADKPQDLKLWQIRWDDSSGERHVRVFKTFQAAKQCHATLRSVEWSKIERV